MKLETLNPILPNNGNKDVIIIVSIIVASIIGYIIYKKYFSE